MKKDLLAISDLTLKDIEKILKRSAALKTMLKKGKSHQTLKGKSLGMIFEKSSTRTRVSFEVGMYHLGGQALFLSSNDLQIGRGEPIADTARTLSRYLDGIMIRTFSQETVEEFARYATIPVINGLTDLHHPCQALADLLTIQEKRKKLKGLSLAYVGDGNNVANSLIQACVKVGMNFRSPARGDTSSKVPFFEKQKLRQGRRVRTLSSQPIPIAPSRKQTSCTPMFGRAWDRKLNMPSGSKRSAGIRLTGTS